MSKQFNEITSLSSLRVCVLRFCVKRQSFAGDNRSNGISRASGRGRRAQRIHTFASKR